MIGNITTKIEPKHWFAHSLAVLLRVEKRGSARFNRYIGTEGSDERRNILRATIRDDLLMKIMTRKNS